MIKVQMKAVAVLVLLVLAAMSAAAQQYPALKGRVNDFAQMLTSSEEQMLEAKLADFERKTSIQIVIAVVQTLNGDTPAEYATKLGTQWGIGQRGLDNGILILWHPADRDWFISVGYGLEAYLPDGRVGQIGRENLVPSFRAGNWYVGLDQTVNAITAHLGEVSWQQREDAARLRVEQEKIEADQAELARIERNRRFKFVLWYAGSSLLIFLILLGLSKAISIWNDRRKLRKQLRTDLGEQKARLAELAANLQDKRVYVLERLPLKHDAESANQCYVNASEAALTRLNQIDHWLVQMKKDPYGVRREILRCDFEHPFELVRHMEQLAEGYSKALVDAPERIVEVQTFLEKCEKEVLLLRSDGYVTRHEDAFKQAAQLLYQAAKYLSSRPADPVKAIGCANFARELVTEKVRRCKILPAVRAANNELFSTLESKESDLRQMLKDPKYKRAVTQLKQVCGPAVWEGCVQEFETVSFRLSQISALLAELKQLNSMEVQEFEQAHRKAQDLLRQVEDLRQRVLDVEVLYSKQIEAKDLAKTRFAEARELFRRDASIFSHNDVSHSAVNEHRSAYSLFKGAESEFQAAAFADWVLLLEKLEGSIRKCDHAYQSARSDIRRAEERREADRRRAAEAAAAAEAARRRRNSSSSLGSSSGGFGGGGFRGGGGRFGGGGAGGKY